jgi:hypothetical protein
MKSIREVEMDYSPHHNDNPLGWAKPKFRKHMVRRVTHFLIRKDTENGYSLAILCVLEDFLGLSLQSFFGRNTL